MWKIMCLCTTAWTVCFQHKTDKYPAVSSPVFTNMINNWLQYITTFLNPQIDVTHLRVMEWKIISCWILGPFSFQLGAVLFNKMTFAPLSGVILLWEDAEIPHNTEQQTETQVHSRFRNTPILFASEDKKFHHLFFLLEPPFLRTVAYVSELLLLVLQEGS